MIASDCCDASVDGIEGGIETGICPACGEHCEFNEQGGNDED